jgi:hypothetical protein
MHDILAAISPDKIKDMQVRTDLGLRWPLTTRPNATWLPHISAHAACRLLPVAEVPGMCQPPPVVVHPVGGHLRGGWQVSVGVGGWVGTRLWCV